MSDEVSTLRLYASCIHRLMRASPRLWRFFSSYVRIARCGLLNQVLSFVKIPLRGLSVLEIGCGHGFYGPLYLMLGARAYTGCDSALDLSSTLASDVRTNQPVDIGISGQRLLESMNGRIEYIEGGWEHLAEDREWDVVTMHTVTEHLMDIEGAFDKVNRILTDEGHFVFLHHNFYSWSGHHREPKRFRDIDPESADQATRIDWRHLLDKPLPDAYSADTLNRIRIDELRSLTERFFQIEEWEEHPTHGFLIHQRLTSEVEDDLLRRGFTRRELTTQSVHCVAVKRQANMAARTHV